MAAVRKSKALSKVNNYYNEVINNVNSATEYEFKQKKNIDHLENIIDIR